MPKMPHSSTANLAALAALEVEPDPSGTLPFLKPFLVHGMEHIVRANSFAAVDGAIGELFSACLPPMLATYAELGLLIDYPDLVQAVTVGLPLVLCGWLGECLRGRVAGLLYPAHILTFTCRAVELFASRLKNQHTLPLRMSRIGHTDDNMVGAVLALSDAVRTFAAGVLIGGPPAQPTTKRQRKAARKRRLANYVLINKRQGVIANISTLCRLAGVPRTGRGSGAQWLSGHLPDSAVTCTKVEAALSFQPPSCIHPKELS